MLWARLVSKEREFTGALGMICTICTIRTIRIMRNRVFTGGLRARIGLETQGFGTGGMHQTERTIFTIIIVLWRCF
jgi:hypothetical protein